MSDLLVVPNISEKEKRKLFAAAEKAIKSLVRMQKLKTYFYSHNGARISSAKVSENKKEASVEISSVGYSFARCTVHLDFKGTGWEPRSVVYGFEVFRKYDEGRYSWAPDHVLAEVFPLKKSAADFEI